MSGGLIALSLALNLLMWSNAVPSVLGTVPCSTFYWFLQFMFIVACLIVTCEVIDTNRKEQRLREKYEVNFDPSEIKFEGDPLNTLLTCGFVGGFAAGGFGLGGGSVFNPVFMYLGMKPKPAAATAMYLVIFTSLNSCIINVCGGLLNLRYGAFLGACNVVGSLVGLHIANGYVRKTGRVSTFVFLLFIVFVLAWIVTPVVSYFELKRLGNSGVDIWAFSGVCS